MELEAIQVQNDANNCMYRTCSLRVCITVRTFVVTQWNIDTCSAVPSAAEANGCRKVTGSMALELCLPVVSVDKPPDV